MPIKDTTFGSITIDGKTYEHDVIIRLSGEVEKQRGTKSLRSSPLRGGVRERPVADGEGSDSGVATINSHIVGCDDDQEQQDHLPPAPSRTRTTRPATQ